MEKQRIAILGSTGSIGTQALEVIERWGELFQAEVLTANDNWQRLVEQALRFGPNAVVIGNEAHYDRVREALEKHYIKVYAGADAIEQIVESSSVDVVISSLVGYAGLFPTVNAIRHGKKVALANKETLVVAGELVTELAREKKVPVIPVDSEHSAVFQCLVGETAPVEKIILTASGGPFRDTPREAMEKATPEQALHHPNWHMGAKITVDSASMMNKGFEVIEARWLFGVEADRIEVAVHPQSVVHSMVQFADGAVKAQLGIPDMKLPIQYALTFPRRLPMPDKRLDFAAGLHLDFLPPDPNKFPCLQMAYDVLREGGNRPCVLNAANEVAVRAFLEGRIAFGGIPKTIARTLEKAAFIARPGLDDYRLSDQEARALAREAL